MRIVLTIDAQAVGGPRAVATIARGYLRGLILHNRILIRRGLVPALYESFMRGRLVFQPEPWAGRFEEFACAKTCIDRGWGDCDDLVPWRCAEIIEREGRLAMPKVYWRMRDADGRPIRDETRWQEAATIGYHTEARIACRCHGRLDCDNSEVEDVAAFLGMARRGMREEDGPRRKAS